MLKTEYALEMMCRTYHYLTETKRSSTCEAETASLSKNVLFSSSVILQYSFFRILISKKECTILQEISSCKCYIVCMLTAILGTRYKIKVMCSWWTAFGTFQMTSSPSSNIGPVVTFSIFATFFLAICWICNFWPSKIMSRIINSILKTVLWKGKWKQNFGLNIQRLAKNVQETTKFLSTLELKIINL